ncbi:schlafen family member 13-like [Nycticebus coucang]|uniref:schlafen family member 13-like n=1 Tax=Nycticebus coucang TaxID=9470 RepID=UPI00234C4718|nr:schlafen family member 13-like [Nycticebus coucang]
MRKQRGSCAAPTLAPRLDKPSHKPITARSAYPQKVGQTGAGIWDKSGGSNSCPGLQDPLSGAVGTEPQVLGKWSGLEAWCVANTVLEGSGTGAFRGYARATSTGLELERCSPASQIVGKERVSMMTNTNEELAEAFASRGSLFERNRLYNAVYSKNGLEHKAVPSDHLTYTPEELWQELVSEHEGLEELIHSFRSLLSNERGCEVLHLLTAQQCELLSKNLRKNRELFVHGLPGSGKTTMAIMIMEKIRNVFHCETDEILYVCENEPLRNGISNKNICKAVTLKTFMENGFEYIQHIIIDGAQNFSTEFGKWYEKAKTITQRAQPCPGVFWIFLDYFQGISIFNETGLPPFSVQYPRAKLTRMFRYAEPIANFLQREMQIIRSNPPRNVPPESLEMILEAEWAWGSQGFLKIETDLTLQEIVTYVADTCKSLFDKRCCSEQDVAVLVSTTFEVECYRYELLRAMRRKRILQLSNACDISGNFIVFDSMQQFSGLERSVVFVILWKTSNILRNTLLCLASRAKERLYILWCRDR